MNSDAECSHAPDGLTRHQLHLLVWEKPIRHLAKTFGISDQDLVTICARFDIPRPAPGHWSKVAVGKAIETRALPPARPGMPDAISIAPIPRSRAAEPAVERELAAARDRTNTLPVAERLTRPHPITAGRS